MDTESSSDSCSGRQKSPAFAGRTGWDILPADFGWGLFFVALLEPRHSAGLDRRRWTFLMTEGSAFDPFEDVLLAQTDRPAELQDVNPRTLSPFQRALLVIDGTVTKLVEAYMMEPLRIVRLKQDTRTLDAPHKWLGVDAGATVATRHVLLRGEHTDELYAYATSLVALERIPESLRSGIERQGGGLGRILDASKLETRREILWYGRERLEDLPWEPGSGGQDFLTRTYRIILAGEPILLIKEHFPLGDRLLPEHH